MEDLVQELRRRVTGEVRFDKYSRILYSTDASIYQIEPRGVVIPRTAEDIQATVELAAKYSVPIVPRGAGTSIVGNSIGAGIILDCSKYLNHILELNAEEHWVRVQPGVVLDQLNSYLSAHNLFFGPDVATSSRASLGGMMGNNSSGARSVVYGKTLDHVLALEVLLANGETATLDAMSRAAWEALSAKTSFPGQLYRRVSEIVRENKDEIDRRFPRIMRRVAGYNLDEFVRQAHNNLAKLVVGSEGTLAVVTEARLNVVPLPKHRPLAIVHFKDLFEALDAVSPILEFEPSAVELLDRNILDLTRGTQEFARRLSFIDGFPAAVLIVEFQGTEAAEPASRLRKLTEFLKSKKMGYACCEALEPAQQADVWYIRKAGLGLLMGTRAPRKPVGFVEDSAVAPERMPEYIRRFDEIVHANGTEAAYYAHASVGCLHIRPKLNLKDSADVGAMAKIADEVSSLALEFGGTISGEHGDGLAHSCWNEKMFGAQIYQAFREVKQAFDPKNILNPGKIVDAPFLTEHFRPQPKNTLSGLKTGMDFTAEGGLSGAIELCNGNAFCRKKGGGTMCPSYMVTLEEEHSTRGRANALRAILTGRLPESALSDPRLLEVFDLCIGCKGCKGECPTNVDMAKLKYEFLHQYHQANGISWRDRLFGHIETLNKLGCATAPLSNLLLGAAPVRWLLERFLGISRRRAMPPFSRETFSRWFDNRSPLEKAGHEQVILFNDTFMTYNTPEVGRAAVKVLEAAGKRVVLPKKRCCGRPFISRGMLDEAKACAEFNVAQLYPYASSGMAIVGCEPSCILTFRDEYPDLLDDDRARVVAERTFLLEEYLETIAKDGESALKLRPAQAPLLLHGHCHMKALAGLEATTRFLKMIPEAKVEVVDSGCCGMAGSFGFEREHYEISMAMGRRSLFSAVEEAPPESRIVAPGVSCRQQIQAGTGRSASHPVEIVAEHLAG